MMDLITTLRRQRNTIDNVLDTIESGRVNEGVKRLRSLRADINYDLGIEEAKAKFVHKVNTIVRSNK